MVSKQRGEKGKNYFLRWFAIGFGSAVLISAVFSSGFLFGNGTFRITLGPNKPVTENRGLPRQLDYSSVNNVYQELVRKYDGKLDEQKLIEGLKKGLVEAAGDPYTTFLTKGEAKEFNEALNGSFSGIGAELGKEGSNVVIISPIKGFPAEKAGLKSKDVIVSIDGQDATGLSVDEAVKRIRGEKGTSVKLVVVRGGTERVELTIVRDTITIASVETKTLDGNVGYIRITRFAEDTKGLVDAAVTDYKAKGVNGIVLDMRGNPGGFLNSAVSVSENWLKPGQLILQEKRGGVVIQSFTASETGPVAGIKTVVLVDEGSASASEITAGALKDNKAAIIMGTTTFGKGSVQEFSTLATGDVLKVTVARWFTPAGKNIDKEGIEPDVVVKLDEEQAKAGKDNQLESARVYILK